jgi:hypothetical protein
MLMGQFMGIAQRQFMEIAQSQFMGIAQRQFMEIAQSQFMGITQRQFMKLPRAVVLEFVIHADAEHTIGA